MKRPRTLTAAFVKNIAEPGRYGDGRGGFGLSLLVRQSASGRLAKGWSQRVRIGGRESNLGLGSFPAVTLSNARGKALANARAVAEGRDPRGSGIPTFAEAAEKTIELQRGSWKGDKTERALEFPSGEICPSQIRGPSGGSSDGRGRAGRDRPDLAKPRGDRDQAQANLERGFQVVYRAWFPGGRSSPCGLGDLAEANRKPEPLRGHAIRRGSRRHRQGPGRGRLPYRAACARIRDPDSRSVWRGEGRTMVGDRPRSRLVDDPRRPDEGWPGIPRSPLRGGPGASNVRSGIQRRLRARLPLGLR